MSPWRIALLSLLVACGNGTDDDPVDTDDTSPPPCSDHPNIPEEYRCLWLDDGCMSGTAPATQVYFLFDGQIDEQGNFSGTETYYWFYPIEGREDDCIDTLAVTGRVSPESPDELGCVGCELVYNLERVEKEKECIIGYNVFFPDQDGNVFRQKLLLDTLNANGEPQENNNVLVMHRKKDNRGNYSTEEYARGTMFPDTEVYAPPMRLTWEGATCKGR